MEASEAFKARQAEVLEQLKNTKLAPREEDAEMVDEKGEPKQMSEEEKQIWEAHKYKDEGNQFFKAKDYKKAISKYVRVHLYLKSIVEQANKNADPALTMAMKKSTLSDD